MNFECVQFQMLLQHTSWNGLALINRTSGIIMTPLKELYQLFISLSSNAVLMRCVVCWPYKTVLSTWNTYSSKSVSCFLFSCATSINTYQDLWDQHCLSTALLSFLCKCGRCLTAPTTSPGVAAGPPGCWQNDRHSPCRPWVRILSQSPKKKDKSVITQSI